MGRLFRGIGLALVLLAVAYGVLWGTLALWFRFPGPEYVRWIVSAAFAVFGLATLVAIFRPVRWRWLTLFVAALVILNVWWNTLVPPSDGDWAPALARQVTGEIDGDTLTLTNMRAFDWRAADDFTEKWVTRTYDLSQLEGVDLYMSYWGGPAMAHFMLSFGFADGEYLAWSIEVRRRNDDGFSPLADFFKAHPIAIVASEERDVVGLRSNIQKADVHLFRLRTSPDRARRLVEAYVAGANSLAERPRWFNSVFTNCSRTAILLARHVGSSLPADWRIIVNGYFPNYLYDRGALDTGFTIAELYRLGDISERAMAVGLSEDYSNAIRDGVPKP